MTLPIDSDARKNLPIHTGVMMYFPDALAEVAKVSVAGNAKHNPGEPLHWARGKSMDQLDALSRHLLDPTGVDVIQIGEQQFIEVLHAAEMAWRALAYLQLLCEERAAKKATTTPHNRPDFSSCPGLGIVF